MVIQEGIFSCPGAAVGHSGGAHLNTGCTAVILDQASNYSAYVGGGAASVRQVSALFAGHSVSVADGFMVCGGSAFGLDACGGGLKALEEAGRGTAVGRMVVPALPSAAVFDLGIGKVRPDFDMGYAAVLDANPDDEREGRAGAGSGCTVGKVIGIDRAMWGGIGVATAKWPNGLHVAALVVVNAFGNIIDPKTGQTVAGARDLTKPGTFISAEASLIDGFMARMAGMNTTIGIVITNANLSGSECYRAATLASAGFTHAIRPCWTGYDGDIVFLGATGAIASDSHQVGVGANAVLQRAIVRAAIAANLDGSLPTV
ncbi:MAG TPA: P1 family peptidase [Myxococcota bacterium]|nr:P1 family peptidase [Myxococcota bacterium]HOS61370.1 P1 family peptidase [Myxococcota bacterium]